MGNLQALFRGLTFLWVNSEIILRLMRWIFFSVAWPSFQQTPLQRLLTEEQWQHLDEINNILLIKQFWLNVVIILKYLNHSCLILLAYIAFYTKCSTIWLTAMISLIFDLIFLYPGEKTFWELQECPCQVRQQMNIYTKQFLLKQLLNQHSVRWLVLQSLNNGFKMFQGQGMM